MATKGQNEGRILDDGSPSPKELFPRVAKTVVKPDYVFNHYELARTNANWDVTTETPAETSVDLTFGSAGAVDASLWTVGHGDTSASIDATAGGYAVALRDTLTSDARWIKTDNAYQGFDHPTTPAYGEIQVAYRYIAGGVSANYDPMGLNLHGGTYGGGANILLTMLQFQYSTAARLAENAADWTTINNHIGPESVAGGCGPFNTAQNDCWIPVTASIPGTNTTPALFRWYQSNGIASANYHWGLADVKIISPKIPSQIPFSNRFQIIRGVGAGQVTKG